MSPALILKYQTCRGDVQITTMPNSHQCLRSLSQFDRIGSIYPQRRDRFPFNLSGSEPPLCLSLKDFQSWSAISQFDLNMSISLVIADSIYLPSEFNRNCHEWNCFRLQKETIIFTDLENNRDVKPRHSVNV